MTGADFAIEIAGKLIVVVWALSFVLALTTTVGSGLMRSIFFALLGIGGIGLWSQLAPELTQTRWLYGALGVAAISLILREVSNVRKSAPQKIDLPSAAICLISAIAATWAVAVLAPKKPGEMTILVAANFGSLAMASATALVLGLLTTLKSSPGAMDPQSENHGSGDRLGNGNESTGKQQRERSEVSQSTVARRDFQVCRVTAAAVFVLQIIVAMNVFFGDGPTDTLRQSERRPEYLMLAWMYSTTLLILVGSVVYVPGRILSRTKTLKVRDWTALTLTCWLAVFALAVALYLPLHWPWSIGFIAPPNASISSAP